MVVGYYQIVFGQSFDGDVIFGCCDQCVVGEVGGLYFVFFQCIVVVVFGVFLDWFKVGVGWGLFVVEGIVDDFVV